MQEIQKRRCAHGLAREELLAECAECGFVGCNAGGRNSELAQHVIATGHQRLRFPRLSLAELKIPSQSAGELRCSGCGAT